MKLDTHQLAWAAGLFDGEGCTFVATSRTAPSLSLDVASSDYRLLVRFMYTVGGIGKVYGPYSNGPRARKPIYFYRSARFSVVQAVMAMLWKFLSKSKRDQYVAALQKLQDLRVARASSPAVLILQPRKVG